MSALLISVVKGEAALARRVLMRGVKRAAFGAASFAVALVLVIAALLMLAIAARDGLIAVGLAPALASVLVAVGLVVVAGILALIGRSLLRRAAQAPGQARDSVRRGASALISTVMKDG